MATSRSYGDACGIARALDVVGERWALLIVRELMFGPQRFSDLRRRLPGVSTNMLTDRLRWLEQHAVLRRRRLPAPVASSIYELTERGRGLEPALVALGAWGVAEPTPSRPSLSAGSILFFLRECARGQPTGPAATFRLQLDDEVWTLRSSPGELAIDPGEPAVSDASLRADPRSLDALLADPSGLEAALEAGTVTAEGNLPVLRRLLSVAGVP